MTRTIQGQAFGKSESSGFANLVQTTAITLNVTPGMVAMLEQIAKDSHQPLETVFNKAIALYRAALNAQSEGKHVGYADSPDGLEVEFTGITSAGSE